MRASARRHPLISVFLPAVLCGCLWAYAALAQETSPAVAAPTEVTASQLEARIQSIEDSATLDEAAKGQLLQLYNQGLELLAGATEWRTKADQFEQLRKSAPEKMEEHQRELLAVPDTPDSTASPDETEEDALTVSMLEIELAEAESALATAQAEVSDLEQESVRRTERRRQIPTLQTEARTRLETARSQLATPPPPTDSPELVEARRLVAQARVQSIEQELRSYNEEMSSYDARGRLLALRLDLATRKVQRAQTEVETLRATLTDKRQEEARKAEVAAREAMLEASNAPIQIRDLAKQLAAENAALTQERTGPDGFLRKIERADAELKAATSALAQLDTDFTTIRKRVEAQGSSSLLGLLLQSHRRSLPDVQQFEKRIAQRQDEIAGIQLEQIGIEEERRQLANIDAVLTANLDNLPDDLSDEQRKTISDVLRQHYHAKREALYTKTADYEAYFDRLIDLTAKQTLLIEKTRELDNYIQERVLWVRSGNPFDLAQVKEAYTALLWLADVKRPTQILDTLWFDANANPVPAALAILALVVLFLARRPMRRRLRESAVQAQKRGNTQVWPTVNAVFHTFLLSLDVPLLLAFAGWRMSASFASTEYTNALGSGLVKAAFILWSVDVAREVLKRNGLGVAHFGWSEKPARATYRTLLWLEILGLPLVLVISTFANLGDNVMEESLGRLCFMLAMILVAVACHRLLRKRGGSLLDLIELARGKSSLNARRVGYFLGLLIPVSLLIAAGLGFYYSALHITSQIHATLLSTFFLVVAVQLALKWMVLARKALAREQARKRLEALRDASTSETDVSVEKEHEIDLARIDAQTMRLVRSAFVIGLAFACYVIWSTDLPALSILDQVKLGTTVDTIQRQITKPDSTEMELTTEEVIVPITLRNAAFFLFIMAVTFIAVQNLPGLIEILLLQRLSLIAGERYAINSIVGYIIAVIGAAWAFTTIGLSWSKVQWLVAAVGLGLGFGLQEIFANLVSGLIILLERPIRVGDTVTVGDISGTVSRIRIRATWITAFNRQELIVPNKEFVTGRLVNWTLSDQVLRVEIPIGIAYGSDIALARKLILDVANGHPLVLADPEPAVYFMGFGDSSLNFELRVHSPDLESFLPIKDAMLTEIDAVFRAHNIEIPFPQRDLHVRSIDSNLSVDMLGPRPPAQDES